jgi:type II secretory pathway pseudopilin PulG
MKVSFEKSRRGGFTLVEVIVTLIIVIMVIGISATFLTTGSNFLNRTETNASDKALAEKAADFVRDRLLYATEVKVVTAGAVEGDFTIPSQSALRGREILFIGEADADGKVGIADTGRLYYQREDEAAPVDVLGEATYRNNKLALSYETTVTGAGVNKSAIFDVRTNVIRDSEQTQSASQIFRMYNIGPNSEPTTNSAIKSWDAEDPEAPEKFYLLITPTTDGYAASGELIAQFDVVDNPPKLTTNGNYVWEDVTGNGYDIKLTFTNNDQPIRNRSLYFDGDGDYGKIEQTGFLQGKQQITVEVCFKYEDDKNSAMLFEYANAANGWNAAGGAFGLVLNSSGSGIELGQCHSVARTGTSFDSAAKGARNFYWDNDPLKFVTISMVVSNKNDDMGRIVYIDGKLQQFTDKYTAGYIDDSSTKTASDVRGGIGNFPLWLGTRKMDTNSGVSYFKGEIAAVRIYDTKLTEDEAAKNAKQDAMRVGS